ncbi:hypothetical protein chiPu_0022059 [Chiloscyllium punctatum]|uniref:Uncharacterized protein n=1 Tax=Chiloscyllium punctatum TaxID=137246 RepID=A0A401RIX9_CHIPU|nr:hypothetical protein [Chiloscyllium punctatum]
MVGKDRAESNRVAERAHGAAYPDVHCPTLYRSDRPSRLAHCTSEPPHLLSQPSPQTDRGGAPQSGRWNDFHPAQSNQEGEEMCIPTAQRIYLIFQLGRTLLVLYKTR